MSFQVGDEVICVNGRKNRGNKGHIIFVQEHPYKIKVQFVNGTQSVLQAASNFELCDGKRKRGEGDEDEKEDDIPPLLDSDEEDEDCDKKTVARKRKTKGRKARTEEKKTQDREINTISRRIARAQQDFLTTTNIRSQNTTSRRNKRAQLDQTTTTNITSQDTTSRGIARAQQDQTTTTNIRSQDTTSRRNKRGTSYADHRFNIETMLRRYQVIPPTSEQLLMHEQRALTSLFMYYDRCGFENITPAEEFVQLE